MKRLLLVLMLLFVASCDDEPDGGTGATITTPTGPTGATSPPPPPPSTPVPDVQGLQRDDARSMLSELGLLMSVEMRYSDEPKGIVLKQTPRPGREVDQGSTVELVVAQPLPHVPNVTAKNLTQARRILRDAGYRVDIRQQQSTTQRDGDVVAQRPVGGTELRPGRNVVLVVINNVCTPGYSPCLRDGPSDYDCYGGTGDGPAYTAPGVTYRVTGFDPYGLDADNDGYGCE